jgi:lipopolysaccharide transport system permease protein
VVRWRIARRPQPWQEAPVLHRLAELWRYRHLVAELVALDLKVRYKGSVLGFVWSLLNPLLMMLVFTVVFSQLFESGIAWFPVFILVALLPWNYLATVVGRGTTSVTQNAALLNKVAFPAEVFPISIVFSSLVNFLLSLPVLFAMMLAYGFPITPSVLVLPILILIQTLFCLAVALFLAALTVQYRDTTIIMEVVLQAWFFLTPVFYAVESVTAQWQGIPAAQVVRWLNPMASLTDYYRDSLYGAVVYLDALVPPSPGFPTTLGLLRTGLTVLALLTLAYAFFIRRSQTFAEAA